jgi:hypothetical protein
VPRQTKVYERLENGAPSLSLGAEVQDTMPSRNRKRTRPSWNSTIEARALNKGSLSSIHIGDHTCSLRINKALATKNYATVDQESINFHSLCALCSSNNRQRIWNFAHSTFSQSTLSRNGKAAYPQSAVSPTPRLPFSNRNSRERLNRCPMRNCKHESEPSRLARDSQWQNR